MNGTAMSVLLRPARADDARAIFEWRNDPWIASLSETGNFSWEEHCEWFKRAVADPSRLLFIIEREDGTGMGMVRLDRIDTRQAAVTIYLMRQFTGHGAGVEALKKACGLAFEKSPDLESIRARIRQRNHESIKAFGKAGFSAPRADASGAVEWVEMVLIRGGKVDADAAPAWTVDNNHIVEFYSDLVEKHGAAPQALDWGSLAAQEKRFAALAQIGSLEGRSVLDVGCGLADLWGYLQRQGLNVDYTGYDLTPAMIERAKQRYPSVRLEVRNLLDEPEPPSRFDYVLASGIFYLRRVNPMAYLETMARRMFALSRLGVAFNTLSVKALQQTPGEFYADPEAVRSLCLKIAPRVVIREDYLPHDFTVYLYKDER